MINELIKRYPQLSPCRSDILLAEKEIIACFEREGKLLLCGNGGSAADCQHIAGELTKGFLKKRSLPKEKKEEMRKNAPSLSEETLSLLQGGLPAVPLPSMTALNSAFCNDVDPRLIYAQGVLSLGKKEDALLALSTSGNSENVYLAAETAKALGLKVIALTGKSGGKLKKLADICLCVPEEETFKIQELHLPVYHYLCAKAENHFFKE